MKTGEVSGDSIKPVRFLNMIPIKKKVKIPPESRGRNGSAKYPFLTMEVGDSFEFPLAERSRISSAAVAHGRRYGVKFTVRQIDDKKAGVWRIK